jgi:hypothetical protein
MVDNPQENRVAPFKYWRLFELVLGAICFFSVGTVAAILHNPEWHAHLLRLFGRSWNTFVAQDVGSTNRGFLNGSLEAIFSILTVAVMIGYLHGFKEFRKHKAETAIIALLAIPTVTALVYGTQFAWEVANTAYNDHASLALRNKDLKQDRDSWEAKATNNALIVCTPVREPKLEVLIAGVDVNHRNVTIGSTDPTTASLQMAVKNVGSADAPGVAMRLYLKAGFQNPNVYDLDWQKVVSDEPNYPDEYYSANSIPANPPVIHIGEAWGWASFTIRLQKGASTTSAIPVMIKVFYGASKPTVVNFSVRVVKK